MNIKNNNSKIPGSEELQKRLLAYSKIDYIMNGENEFLKIYHYDDKNWVKNGHYFRIDDSGGDHYHVLISPAGSVVKGFGHETEMSPYNFSDEDMPALIQTHDFYKGMPQVLYQLLEDDALEKDLVTFCVWQKSEEKHWSYAPIDIPSNWADGTKDFLTYVFPPEEYLQWFEEYYEKPLDKKVFHKIYTGEEITADIIEKIPTEHNKQALLKGLEENF